MFCVSILFKQNGLCGFPGLPVFFSYNVWCGGHFSCVLEFPVAQFLRCVVLELKYATVLNFYVWKSLFSAFLLRYVVCCWLLCVLVPGWNHVFWSAWVSLAFSSSLFGLSVSKYGVYIRVLSTPLSWVGCGQCHIEVSVTMSWFPVGMIDRTLLFWFCYQDIQDNSSVFFSSISLMNFMLVCMLLRCWSVF